MLQLPVTINGTTTTLAALWATATAAAPPLADQPWTGVIIWGLAIALGISVVVAIGLLLSELTLAADVDNAHSDWEALTGNVQSLLDTLSALGCPAPADTSLPTCAAIGD